MLCFGIFAGHLIQVLIIKRVKINSENLKIRNVIKSLIMF